MYNSDITEDFKLYEKGLDYNRKLRPDYYKTIDTNEAFYAGDQWRGVKANGLSTPVFNIFKQIIDHKIAMILSQKVTMKFTVENVADDTEDPNEQEMQKKVEMLNHKCEEKWEKDKLDTMLRDLLLDGANTGDYCVYVYWDKNKDTKQSYGITVDEITGETIPVPIIGDFVNEIVDGSNVMFGNPNDRRVESQPYILIAGRDLVSKLREEARANGIPEEEVQKIVGDNEYNEQPGDRGKIELDYEGGEGKCNYIIKLWKQDGVIHHRKSTKYAMIYKDVATKQKRYPVAWGNWQRRKNSYHGQAEGTGIVDNQIAINQLYAMIIYYLKLTAYGKVIYDSTRIAAWDNRIGAAIPVAGDITNAVMQLQPGQLNQMVVAFAENIIKTTKDLSGANEAALGNINPENASGKSIIATQQASAIPLDNIKENLYQFVEDLGLIWADFIQAYYEVPRKISYTEKGVTKVGEINGQDYTDIPLSLKIDVGPSNYWSEITSVQTLDNLLANNRITFLQYLERIPDGYITDKQGLIDYLKEQEAQQAMQANQNAQYEQMAQWLDGQPPEVQARIKSLPPQQMEQEVMRMMGGVQ